jgi:hypothetical protein
VEDFSDGKKLKSISRLSFKDHDVVELRDDVKYDVTLPRVNIPCVNEDCSGVENPDVVLIRYDENNARYMYYCTNCKTKWLPEEK